MRLRDTARAMSEEHVEVVRRIFEAWALADWSIGNDYYDQHVVFVISPDFPAFGVYYGFDQVRAYWRDFLEQFERTTLEAERLQAAGDTVLARVVQYAKGRASGIEGDIPFFMLFTFRADKIVRVESMIEEAQALEAAGLTEQDARPGL
jgi:ketosteroid isomerase-like protein